MKKNKIQKNLRKIVAVCIISLAVLAAPAKKAEAILAIPCLGPASEDGCLATTLIETQHNIFEDQLMRDISNSWVNYRNWLMNEFFRQSVLPALMLFSQQMTAVAMDQAMIIGTFLDAKHQLETQRLFQELQTQAHKDYHPSEDFCWFGTNVRSLAASDQLSRFNAVALGEIQMERHLGTAHGSAAESADFDKANRWFNFQQIYCDVKDNNWISGVTGSGLEYACGAIGMGNPGTRVNKDIDFTRAIEDKRTLDVNFTNGGAPTDDEVDVIALGNNLYGHEILSRSAFREYLKNKEYQHLYLALRSVAAKRSVAQNSYDAIVGIKSAGSSAESAATGSSQFLAAVLTELGVPATDVYNIIGNNPSYYAQLEILAKKIYQNPDFYANLYDKPANVARKSVALKAIDLMLDRAIFESQIRQEMVTSVLLSAKLREPFRKVNKDLAAGGN